MSAIDWLAASARDARSPGVASTTARPVTADADNLDELRPFSKIRSRHLQREASVYVRQSTYHQVVEHGESLARQYALRDRAQALGWPASNIVLIDDDLGMSGRGTDNRRGFERLLADVAQDRVGVVLALEMSRLARNSREWHNLFDLCAVRDTLLADEDGVYDPGDINDRLILGMKGIMSEMELHMMKTRLERGRRNKAMRGELFHSVPWGYVLLPDGTVALDPDEQVRAAVQILFETYKVLGSAYATLRYLRRLDVKLPKRESDGRLVWRPATETIVTTALHHPLYAGAYSWGRRRTQIQADPAGRMSQRRQTRPRAEWTVLLHDRTPAYITWDQYLANQRQMLDNRPSAETKGSPGDGSALLAGLLFCGRCGRKMYVEYGNGRDGRYLCSRRQIVPTDERCGGLPARCLNELIGRLVLQVLTPASIELSVRAVEHASQQRRQRETQLRHNMERATYESERAERQYQAVEPENRLVARSLEERWEAALRQQHSAKEAYDHFQRETPIEVSPAERRSFEELSRDIPGLWHAPETTSRERKEIVRCLIERATIDLIANEKYVDVSIRWAGGMESRHGLRRPVAGYRQLDDFGQLMARILELRRAGWRAPRIAEQLNSEAFRTPKQCGGFTAAVVRALFPRLGLTQKGSTPQGIEPPQWTAGALARRLNIPEKKLKDWVRFGYVRAIERPFGGVWILHADELELRQLAARVAYCRQGCHYPAALAAASHLEVKDTHKSC